MSVLSMLLGLVISLAGPQQGVHEETTRSNARKEALGGFEISRIMVHDLPVPIPAVSNYRREGRNPEIITIEASGNFDALNSFFATAMPEFRWKPMAPVASSARACWRQVNQKTMSVETACITIPEEGNKATLNVRSVGDAR